MLVPAREHPGLLVDTETGTVFRVSHGETVPAKPFYSNGQRFVTFCGHKASYGRVVATTLIPEVPGKPYVGYRDGNKENTAPSNLFWTDISELRSPCKRTPAKEYQKDTYRKYFSFVLFSDGIQRWCDKGVAEELLRLKPEDRHFKPEYKTPLSVLRGKK